MKTIQDLLVGIQYKVICGDVTTRVLDIFYDSRKVQKESVFVCVVGYVSDGHTYLKTAVEKGASVIIIQEGQTVLSMQELSDIGRNSSVTILAVTDSRRALASISAKYFDDPSHRISLYGITGTKGKTTTTYMLRDIFLTAGKETGLIGTVSNIIGDTIRPASHTTPESYELQSLLSEMCDAGSENCIMEVSSQGLMLDRVYACQFVTSAFTNLYHDHIGANEHANMEEYLDAKMRLFDLSQHAVINADCSVADQVKAYASERCPVFMYGIDREADIRATELRKEFRDGRIGTTFHLVSPWYTGDVFVAMPGKFNVYNALCAITFAGIAGVSFEHVCKALSVASVPGRIQSVPNTLGFQVFVDYAHNAASLENLLGTLREYCTGRILTVFGCGGNRSKTRRYEMGEVSGNMSDITVITSDNPRNEEPMDIISDILQGFSKTNGTYLLEPDRKSAIQLALQTAKNDDFVVIAGKGHEDYQIFKDRTIHFDDSEVALALLKEME